MLPSSSGEDNALSRRRRGFEFRWERQRFRVETMPHFPLYRKRYDAAVFFPVPVDYSPQVGQVLDFCNETSNVRAIKAHLNEAEFQDCLISVNMLGLEFFCEWIEYSDFDNADNDPAARLIHFGSVGPDAWCLRVHYASPFTGKLSNFVKLGIAGDQAAFFRDMTMLRTIGLSKTSLVANMEAYRDG